MGLNKKSVNQSTWDQLRQSEKKPYTKLNYDTITSVIHDVLFPPIQAAVSTDKDYWYTQPELSTEDLAVQMLDALDDLEGVLRG